MFDYFDIGSAEQFQFLRIPKIMIKEKDIFNISIESKMLYGLMLDRMTLSLKNNWIDDSGKVYIYYKNESIQEDLQVSENKASKLLKELIKIGLVEKKQIGFNRTNRIYVKNFMTPFNIKNSDKALKNTNRKICGMETLKTEVSKPQNLRSNNTNINNTDFNKSSSSYSSKGEELKSKTKTEEEDTSTYKDENLKKDIKKASNFDESQTQKVEEIQLITNKKLNKSLNKNQVVKLLIESKYDIETIKKAIEIAKNQANIRNLSGFLLDVIRNPENYEQIGYESSNDNKETKSKNRFVNYKGRNYDFDELDRLEEEYNDKLFSGQPKQSYNALE